MTEGFPWALYGKPPGAAHDPFQLVYRSPQISAAAAAAFDELTLSVRWKSAGDGIYPPLSALWPVPGSADVLIARIEDAGSDASGRPHVLRVRGVFVGADQPVQDANFVAALLTAEWPEISLQTPPPLLTLKTVGSAPVELRTLLADFHERHRRWPRLLHGSRRALEAANFEAFSHSDGENSTPSMIIQEPHPTTRAASKNKSALPGFDRSPVSSKRWPAVVAVLLILLSVVVMMLWRERSALRATQQALDAEKKSFREQLEIEQMSGVKTRSDIAELRRDLAELQERLQAEKEEFARWRELCRRHEIHDFPDLEVRLKTFEKNRSPAIRTREQHLKQLSPIKRALSDLEGNVNKLQKAVQSFEAEPASQ